MKNHKLIQSYVRDTWFVSTIWRQSSAPIVSAPWYYETIVWEWDPETRERGNIISSHDGGSDYVMAARHHARVCEDLILTVRGG